jgi:N-acetylmuramic acid 6-phosphate (MurNAc-6-P) etherase
MERKRSLTETPNPLTGNIDLAGPLGIVRLLRQTDAQIFAGFETYPGFYDKDVLDAIARVASVAQEILEHPRGRVVFSGAGTSGRLAMFLAREFNAMFRSLDKRPFEYIIAGGPAALIQAQEGAEDDPHQAQKDLKQCIGNAERVLYFGITCGFSAPYVAGQLEYALDNPQWHAVLVGFNPVELARATPVENWPVSFKVTAERVASAENGSILNPIVGPEPITGSTRMKSGTATKILLEILFVAVYNLMKGNLASSNFREFLLQSLFAYENAYRKTYLAVDTLAKVVEHAGSCLRQKGHIYYLGGAGRAAAVGENVVDAGILGLIDASECPPTFGADFEDVRGFVEGGWKCLFPDGTVDLSPRAPHYRISLEDFQSLKLSTLSSRDICIALGNTPQLQALIEKAQSQGAKVVNVVWTGTSLEADFIIPITCGVDEYLGVAPIEMSLKLILNAITTGAHVLAGKVFGNRMVDLRISNNKLFHRTIGIISDLMKVSPDEALDALLKAIFQTDELTDAQREAPVSLCIETAKTAEKVVPTALLLATGRFTYKEARAALARNPIVRSVISEYVK